MKKVETSFANVKNDIRSFYNPGLHHFIVMNAVDLGDRLDYQWFFCDYAHPCCITVFTAQSAADIEVPSIKDLVASAWVAEAELVDLMDIRIEGAKNGFVLEPDFKPGPLRKKK